MSYLENPSSDWTTGGILTGDLEFPVTGYIMNCGSKRYRITMDCTGTFVITEIITPTGDNTGIPIGFFPLTITYAN